MTTSDPGCLASVNYGAQFDPSLSRDLQEFLISYGITPILTDQLAVESVLSSVQDEIPALIDAPFVPDVDGAAASLTFRLQGYLFQNGIPSRAAQKISATMLLQTMMEQQAQELVLDPELTQGGAGQSPLPPLPDIMDSPLHTITSDGRTTAPQDCKLSQTAESVASASLNRERPLSRQDSLFGENLNSFDDEAEFGADCTLSDDTAPEHMRHVRGSNRDEGPAISPKQTGIDHGSDADAELEEEKGIIIPDSPDYTLPMDLDNEEFWQLSLSTSKAFTATEIRTPAIAALAPADDAISTKFPNERYYKFMEHALEYVAYRLPAVVVTLARAQRMTSAVIFGQFAVNLLGQGIFTTMVADFERATTRGDDIELAKMCLADCINIISERLDMDLGHDLQRMVIEEGMWYHNPLDGVEGSEESAHKRDKKSISKGSRDGRHVARRVNAGRKNRVVRDEDDEY